LGKRKIINEDIDIMLKDISENYKLDYEEKLNIYL
jgi:hypothetical protein